MEGAANRIGGTNLWMGSKPAVGLHLRRDYDVVVLAAQEYQPPQRWFDAVGIKTLRVMLDDSGPPPTAREVRDARAAGHQVAGFLRAGKRVLVTCAMGLNRSGLVAGLALMEAYGMDADSVIRAIRGSRSPDALNNHYFTAVMRGTYQAPREVQATYQAPREALAA
jgi:protein-tyrosine phosphatase